MKRFLLVDDNSALRSALRLMLETRLSAQPEAAEAASAAHADAFVSKIDPPSEVLNAIRRLNGKN